MDKHDDKAAEARVKQKAEDSKREFDAPLACRRCGLPVPIWRDDTRFCSSSCEELGSKSE